MCSEYICYPFIFNVVISVLMLGRVAQIAYYNITFMLTSLDSFNNETIVLFSQGT